MCSGGNLDLIVTKTDQCTCIGRSKSTLGRSLYIYLDQEIFAVRRRLLPTKIKREI